jgi:hypothetical protein
VHVEILSKKNPAEKGRDKFGKYYVLQIFIAPHSRLLRPVCATTIGQFCGLCFAGICALCTSVNDSAKYNRNNFEDQAYFPQKSSG